MSVTAGGADPAAFLPAVGHLQGRLAQYELVGQHWLGINYLRLHSSSNTRRQTFAMLRAAEPF